MTQSGSPADRTELPMSKSSANFYRAFDVSGLAVWVAGGNGSVGRAVATLFALGGADVLATDGSELGDALPYRTGICNVTDRTDIHQVVEGFAQSRGLDVLVNCTSGWQGQDVFDVTEGSWDAVFATNLKGAFLCSQAAARNMIECGSQGAIVNVGSIDAELFFADSTVSSTSHGGLNALTRTMALALAPHRIRVNAVALSILEDEATQIRRPSSPLGAIDARTDIAPSVVFLSTSGASFVTGATLYVDGGRMTSV